VSEARSGTGFEHFEHTADLGLRAWAPDLPALFAAAAEALFAAIVERIPTEDPATEIHLDVPGERRDWLLFDWLAELLFVFATRRLLLSDFRVVLGPGGLTAAARARPADPARHALLHEVKAITYHDLRVEATPAGWLAEIIVDI